MRIFSIYVYASKSRTYTLTHTHTHTYIHTYIHTRIYACLFDLYSLHLYDIICPLYMISARLHFRRLRTKHQFVMISAPPHRQGYSLPHILSLSQSLSLSISLFCLPSLSLFQQFIIISAPQDRQRETEQESEIARE